MSQRKNTAFTARASIYCATATCFVLPFSSSLLSLFSILTLLFWILSGNIKKIPGLLKVDPATLLAFLLFLYFVAAIFYSSADLTYALKILKKYRELLYFPILLSLLAGNSDASKKCEYGFWAGCTVLMIISYGMYLSIIPGHRFGNSVVYHITHSFFMATLAFWALQQFVATSGYRIVYIILFAAAIINLFYIAPGRTGMLVFLCLFLLFLVQRLRLRYLLAGLVLFCAAVTGIFYTSDNFSTRTEKAYQEIREYHYGDSRTSLGQRFDWWTTSLRLIKEKPLFGYGTGSYKGEHERKTTGTEIEPTDNPHNEFLFVSEQLGLTGGILFLLIFIAEAWYSFRMERNDRYIFQGMILAMFIGCLMNSFLFDSHQGHFWAFLSCIFLARLHQGKHNNNQ